MSPTKKPIRWGIIGIGHIAYKFADGLRFVENAMLAGAASSSISRARRFAAHFDVPMVFDSYEELAASKDIDVVYISSYTNLHYEHMQLCLDHGKHVLCEKPLTTRSSDSRQMFRLAAEKDLFLMEAIWTRFLPSIFFLDQLVAQKRYGDITHIEATFGFKAPEDPQGRLLNKALGGGALLDIGIYPLFLCHHLLGPPRTTQAEISIGPTDVDVCAKINQTYSNASANLACSLLEPLPNDAQIHFQDAKVVLQSRWHGPTDVIVHTQTSEKAPLSWFGNGYNYEAHYTTEQLLAGNTDQTMVPPDLTISLAQQIEDLLANADIHKKKRL